jgi:hypothetical protein
LLVAPFLQLASFGNPCPYRQGNFVTEITNPGNQQVSPGFDKNRQTNEMESNI